MRVLGGTLFQAVNSKAWLMAINIAIPVTPREGANLSHTLMTIVAFTLLNMPCVLVWALLARCAAGHLEAVQRRDGANGGNRAVAAF